ncbi:MAG: calcium-binding protein [Burkholderiales bacterium]
MGGLGNDTFAIDNAGDTITEASGEGTDTVITSLTYTAGANIENVTLYTNYVIDGTGNELNNVLTGSTAANVLDGRGGNDTMIGGLGDDTYVVDSLGDVVTEGTSAGTDAVQTALAYTLGSNVENLTLTGSGNVNGIGNTLTNILTGNAGNNSLDGQGGNDTLIGGEGNDFIVGGTGADSMVGGLGNDTFAIDNAGDTITEASGEGTDTVITSLTYTAGANIENVTLYTNYVIDGTGNELNNVLTGSTAANVLDGAGGNDTMIGGTGADSYRFGRGWGIDTVQENDTTAGVKDLVVLQGTVTQADVSFSQAGNNLEMLIGATGDKLVFTNWYLGSQYHAEEFRFTDGSVLTDSQAQGLVGAMAAFSAGASASGLSASSAMVGFGPRTLAANTLV